MTFRLVPTALDRWIFPAFLLVAVIANTVMDLRRQMMSTKDISALLQPRHPTLLVPDFARTVDWYEKKLGFARLPTWSPNTSHAFLLRDGNLIEIRDGAGQVTTAQVSGVNREHRIFGKRPIPLSVDDVDKEATILVERGVRLVMAPNTFPRRGLRAGVFQDQNGTLIELQEHH